MSPPIAMMTKESVNRAYDPVGAHEKQCYADT